MPDILYRLLAYVGAAALLVGAGYYYGGEHERNAISAEVAASLVKARTVEAKWQDKFNLNARHLTNEINSIAAERDATAGRLRDARKARMPEAARAECQGGTGSELSGPDAEFLVREAARADTIRAALTACYADLDTLH